MSIDSFTTLELIAYAAAIIAGVLVCISFS